MTGFSATPEGQPGALGQSKGAGTSCSEVGPPLALGAALGHHTSGSPRLAQLHEAVVGEGRAPSSRLVQASLCHRWVQRHPGHQGPRLRPHLAVVFSDLHVGL